MKIGVNIKSKLPKINGVNIIGLPKWEKETDRKYIRKQLWYRLKNNNSDFFRRKI